MLRYFRGMWFCRWRGKRISRRRSIERSCRLYSSLCDVLVCVVSILTENRGRGRGKKDIQGVDGRRGGWGGGGISKVGLSGVVEGNQGKGGLLTQRMSRRCCCSLRFCMCSCKCKIRLVGIGRLCDRSWCGHSIEHRPLGNEGLVFFFVYIAIYIYIFLYFPSG